MVRGCVVAIAVSFAACDSPTRPETRRGIEGIVIRCDVPPADPLICTARSTCALYPCPGQPSDITQLATWTSADPAVVVLTAPGVVHATGVGNSFVTAERLGHGSSWRTIVVLPNMPPLPTFEIDGSVYRSGMTVAAGPIQGAVVEITNGLVAGRTATTGVPPAPVPGFPSLSSESPGYYRFYGIPPGTYRLRVTKDGFASQEQTVTVSSLGGPIGNFALDPI